MTDFAGLVRVLFVVAVSSVGPVYAQENVTQLTVSAANLKQHVFAHRKKPDYCYLLTNKDGKKLRQIAVRANTQLVKIAINEGGYDTENDPEQHFYQSDHYNFAKQGISALFFTSGTHADYHKPTDTADRINYEVLAKQGHPGVSNCLGSG